MYGYMFVERNFKSVKHFAQELHEYANEQAQEGWRYIECHRFPGKHHESIAAVLVFERKNEKRHQWNGE